MNNLNIYQNYELNVSNQASWDKSKSEFIKKNNENDSIIKRRINSISLITNEKSRTFLSVQAGFVVQVPGKCIYAAYQRDTYAHNVGTDPKTEIEQENLESELARLNQNYGIATPLK